MKRIFLIVCVLLMHIIVFAQKNIKILIKEDSSRLIDIFYQVESQTDYSFTYDVSAISINSKVQIAKGQYQLVDLLDRLSKLKSIKYRIVKTNIALKPMKYYTLSGIITDKQSGETLIGASVFELTKRVGIITNSYGFYSLRIPEGKAQIEFSFVGYQSFILDVDVSHNMRYDVKLKSAAIEMNDVIVSGRIKNANILRTPVGKESISAEYINSIVTIGGEADVIKSLQHLSGVKAVADGSAQMSVRGGSYDQNLILLDEAPVYNPSHALGFFSVFNSDAFKSTDLYKAYIPSKYGGRLSSVVDIRTKDGNNEKIAFNGSIGLLASRLTIDGPIGEDTNFLLAGRYSYAGHLLNAAEGLDLSDDLSKNSDVSFSDVNLKLSHKINDNNRIYFSAYRGRDNFYYANIDEQSAMDWGNITSTLRLNTILSDKLFLNTSLIYSKYDYSYILKDDSRSFDWTASFRDINIKTDFDYLINTNNTVRFGAEISTSDILPGKISPRDDSSNSKEITLKEHKAYQVAAYLEDKFNFGESLEFNMGLRFSSMFSSKENDSKKYFNIEPRLSLRYSFNESTSIKTSYTRTNQYLHLMSNSALGFPTDIWLPSNEYIKPQSSNQYSIGFYKNLSNDVIETSVEVYYKELNNMIDFIDNSDLFINEKIHEQVLAGKGRAYGIDFSIKKLRGRTRFMANYSYSRTFKTIEGINGGNEFPMVFDKPHTFDLSIMHKLSKSLDLSASWTYASGGTATLPTGQFVYKGMTFLNYTARNGYRLPANHRLDIMATYTRKHKHFESQWRIGVYNVYARHNIFALMVKPDKYNINSMNAKMMYITSIMPTISYTFKF